MTRFTKLTAPLLAVALLTTGCQTSSTGAPGISGQAVGAALGAIGGGVAGSQFGKGRGQLAATIAGTVLGGIVGSAIVARLSPQGQQAAYASTQQAMTAAPVNQPVRWADPVNPQIYGTVTPTTPAYYVEVDPAGYLGPVQQQQPQYAQQQYAQPQQQYAQGPYTRPQVVATSSSVECREYQTAVFSGGQPETLTGRMCRRGPGQPWKPANDGFVGI